MAVTMSLPAPAITATIAALRRAADRLEKVEKSDYFQDGRLIFTVLHEDQDIVRAALATIPRDVKHPKTTRR